MMKTLKELKAALKTCKTLYVWCNWQVEEGDYIEASKPKFLRSIGADTPNDGAHDGLHDNTPINFRVESEEIYVN